MVSLSDHQVNSYARYEDSVGDVEFRWLEIECVKDLSECMRVDEML